VIVTKSFDGQRIAITPYVEAGFDEVYVANMGQYTVDMMNLYRTEILPELRRNLTP